MDILDFMFKMRSFNMLERIYIQDEKRICTKKKIDFMKGLATNCKLPESYTGQFVNIRLHYDFE